MRQVKIRKITENITVAAPLGTQTNESHQYLQLYFVESGEIAPDNFYTLKQGNIEVTCSVIDGRARGVEILDSNQPIFLI